MIKGRVKVSGEAGSLAVVVCAGSLREAEQIVKKRYPESAVGIAFPLYKVAVPGSSRPPQNAPLTSGIPSSLKTTRSLSIL